MRSIEEKIEILSSIILDIEGCNIVMCYKTPLKKEAYKKVIIYYYDIHKGLKYGVIFRVFGSALYTADEETFQALIKEVRLVLNKYNKSKKNL